MYQKKVSECKRKKKCRKWQAKIPYDETLISCIRQNVKLNIVLCVIELLDL
jgi:hypothetical protein